jgi:DNA-nicking Smr family endonuclease
MTDNDEAWNDFIKCIEKLDPKNPKLAVKKKSKPIYISHQPIIRDPQISFETVFDKFDHQLRKKDFIIDAKLDLHGFTQEEAKSALLKFIENAINHRYINLLIITGKGVRLDGARGIIKQKLPEWLNSETFAKYIGAYSHAKAQHGGEGAFYVRLKRK